METGRRAPDRRLKSAWRETKATAVISARKPVFPFLSASTEFHGVKSRSKRKKPAKIWRENSEEFPLLS